MKSKKSNAIDIAAIVREAEAAGSRRCKKWTPEVSAIVRQMIGANPHIAPVKIAELLKAHGVCDISGERVHYWIKQEKIR